MARLDPRATHLVIIISKGGYGLVCLELDSYTTSPRYAAAAVDKERAH